MTTRNQSIQIPNDLYERLKTAAEVKNVDPVRYIETLLEKDEQKNQPLSEDDQAIAPLYRLHEYAIDIGITDFAENLDHYLYGVDKVNDNK